MFRFFRNLFYRTTLGDQNYKFLFDTPPSDEFVAIDCETTGLNPRRDEIVAIAAIRIRGSLILTSEAFRALVRSDTASSTAAVKIHQIRKQDLADGRPMHKVIPELLRFIGARPIVGYYVDFDVAMLDKYVFPYIEAKLPNERIDVSTIYYGLKYNNAPHGTVHDLSFSSILTDLHIPKIELHDAFNDAMITAMIYLQLKDMQRRNIKIKRTGQKRIHFPAGT